MLRGLHQFSSWNVVGRTSHSFKHAYANMSRRRAIFPCSAQPKPMYWGFSWHNLTKSLVASNVLLVVCPLCDRPSTFIASKHVQVSSGTNTIRLVSFSAESHAASTEGR